MAKKRFVLLIVCVMCLIGLYVDCAKAQKTPVALGEGELQEELQEVIDNLEQNSQTQNSTENSTIAQFQEKADNEDSAIAGSLTYNDYEYFVLEDGTIEINRYYGKDNSLIIPENIKGYIVSSLGEHSFFDTDLISVVIPGSIRIIKKGAFSSCRKLETVYISFGAEILEDQVFSGCIKLKNIYLPNSLVSIGKMAFFSCLRLKSICIPDSVKSIDAAAFYGDVILEEVTLSKNMELISKSLFLDCEKLRHVIIPDGIKTIAGGAFGNCWHLDHLVLPNSIVSIEDNSFRECDTITIYANEDSYIEEFCQRNEIHFLPLQNFDDSVFEVKEFEIGKNVKWGMAEYEVEIIEGKPTEHTKEGNYEVISYVDNSYTNYAVMEAFAFFDNKLCGVFNYITNASQELYDAIYKAMMTEYGDTRNKKPYLFYRLFAEMYGLDNMKNDQIDRLPVSVWEYSDGTIIWLYLTQTEHTENSGIDICFFSPSSDLLLYE